MTMCDILEHSLTCFTEGEETDHKAAYGNDFPSPGVCFACHLLVSIMQVGAANILNMFV